MNFDELNHEDDFKNWLPDNGVKKSADAYISSLKNLQNRIELDLSKALINGTEEIELKITPKLYNNNESRAQDVVSHVRKYYDYLKQK